MIDKKHCAECLMFKDFAEKIERIGKLKDGFSDLYYDTLQKLELAERHNTELLSTITNADADRPHGRLIDADKLEPLFYEHLDDRAMAGAMNAIADAPTVEVRQSADAEPIVIRSRTLMPTKDFKEWAKRVRETNPNAIVVPCDAEVVSADAVVRCKDCRHIYKNDFCSFYGCPTEADGYCNNGERREE